MVNGPHINSARGAKYRNPRSPFPTNFRDGLVGPLVGDSWPELKAEDVDWESTNEASFVYESVIRPTVATRTIRLRFRLKTFVFFLGLLAIVLGYGIYKDNPDLVRRVLHVLELNNQEQATSEFPP